MITLSQKPQCLLYVILALNIVRHNMKGSHDHVPQMPGAWACPTTVSCWVVPTEVFHPPLLTLIFLSAAPECHEPMEECLARHLPLSAQLELFHDQSLKNAKCNKPDTFCNSNSINCSMNYISSYTLDFYWASARTVTMHLLPLGLSS